MHRSETCVTLDGLIRSRRTNLRVDLTKAVDDELVSWLCELATWAPNHKRTEPWRFAAIQGDARRRLGELTVEYLREAGLGDATVHDKTLGKFERAPVVVLVASQSAPGADTKRREEDRDAVAAGVQNLLLGATAAGLASYWGSGPVMDAPAVKQWCGFADDAEIVAIVYLGWPLAGAPVPDRAAAVISYLR